MNRRLTLEMRVRVKRCLRRHGVVVAWGESDDVLLLRLTNLAARRPRARSMVALYAPRLP